MKNKWRLPTVNELHEVFDYKKGEPKIYGFTLNYYWSSTEHAHYTKSAWIVNFDSGRMGFNPKSYPDYVRCVKEMENGELEWSKSSESAMTWEEACKHCKEMNKENKWRLPTVNELQDVFDYKKGEPKVDGFNSFYYWSANTHAFNTHNAWIVDFHDGYTNYYPKSYTSYVRCVREVEDGGLEWSKSSKSIMTLEEAQNYCMEMNHKEKSDV